jgi:hypothetical protein
LAAWLVLADEYAEREEYGVAAAIHALAAEVQTLRAATVSAGRLREAAQRAIDAYDRLKVETRCKGASPTGDRCSMQVGHDGDHRKWHEGGNVTHWPALSAEEQTNG